jgi:UDP-3-O-[3-hydroxymyristoyl] glucosamine N-acyltransferase
MISPNAHIGGGSWVGPRNDIGAHTWISQGAMIDTASVIGHNTTVAAGTHIASRSEIDPYTRLGSNTTAASTQRNKNQIAHHLTGTIEKLMHLNRE